VSERIVAERSISDILILRTQQACMWHGLGCSRKTETSQPRSLRWAPDRGKNCLHAGKICSEAKSSRLFVQLSSRLSTVYFL
jgi:hypothetical protein